MKQDAESREAAFDKNPAQAKNWTMMTARRSIT